MFASSSTVAWSQRGETSVGARGFQTRDLLTEETPAGRSPNSTSQSRSLGILSLALSSPTGFGTQQAGPLIQLKALLEGTRRLCEALELKRSRHALERDRLEHSSAFCAALSATLTSCSTATELRAVTAIVMAFSHA